MTFGTVAAAGDTEADRPNDADADADGDEEAGDVALEEAA